MGVNSGYSNTTGTNNYFIGIGAGYSNTSGNNNTFIGKQAGFSNATSSGNMFLGTNAGYFTTTGGDNSFFGTDAGYYNTTGSSNMFFGVSAGVSNITGSNNYFAGVAAGGNNTSGSRNIMIGGSSGITNTTGSDNTYIGFGSNGTAALTNATAIGSGVTVATSNTVVLGNAATTVTGTGLAAGLSGLKFANITSATSPGTGGAGKVLSVDATGNVILVGLTGTGVGTTSVGSPLAESWKESDGYLYNNSTNGVVIKGTGLDGNSLIVKGGVLSKEVNVKVEGSEAWPDYVFKPNYKRMTLGEVEKFISINGHLPNIPSATEMAATGNNLGKTDVKLLEKVEELTLYLLDMKKANDAQAAELKALKQQVSKLRKK
jgi:hypothetical protein